MINLLKKYLKIKIAIYGTQHQNLKTIINFRLVNHLYIFKSNRKLKKDGNNNVKITGLFKLSNSKKIRINLDDEKLYKMRIK